MVFNLQIVPWCLFVQPVSLVKFNISTTRFHWAASMLGSPETTSEEGVQKFYTDDIITTQIWDVILFVWGKLPDTKRSVISIKFLSLFHGHCSMGETSGGITKFCRFFQDLVLFNKTSINLWLQWESNNLKFMEGLGHISSTSFCFISLMIKSVWQLLVGPLLRLLLAGCRGYLLVPSLIS